MREKGRRFTLPLAALLALTLGVSGFHYTGDLQAAQTTDPDGYRFSSLWWDLDWVLDEHGIYVATAARDVDGDGTPDSLKLRRSTGSGSSSTSARLRLSGDGRVIEASTSTSFYAMINYQAVPKELMEPGLEKARDFIEEALFPAMRSQPEASLEVLLRPGNPARWLKGPPRLPHNYALLIEDVGQFLEKTALSPAIYEDLKFFLEEQGVDGPLWLEYLGDNHSLYGKHARPNPDMTRKFDENETHSLLASKHGVILYDKASGDYRWIFVSRGGIKLRHPTIESAKFSSENKVLIVAVVGPAEETRTFEVSLDDVPNPPGD